MYSIVEIAGHQYRVKAGDVIDVQKLNEEEGKDVTFDSVLFVGGDKPQVGTPTIAGASVKAKIIRQARSRKVIVFKRKPGLSRTKRGHRQHYTSLFITELNDGAGGSAKEAYKAKAKKEAASGEEKATKKKTTKKAAKKTTKKKTVKKA